jgi:hypothetical protein
VWDAWARSAGRVCASSAGNLRLLLAPFLGTVLAGWGRIGCIGFGGPPAHIKLLRDLCVLG